MTVPMHNPETGKTADVHADEVDNWKQHGWRTSTPGAAPSPLPPPPTAPAAKPTLTLKK